MCKAIEDKSRIIRVPAYVLNSIKKYNASIDSLYQKFGRYPTIEEIASDMGIKPQEVIKLSIYDEDVLSLDDDDMEFE